MRIIRIGALLALLATACAPAVPDLRAPAGESAAASATTTRAPTSTSSTTTSTTQAPTTTTTSTTTTVVPAGPDELTVGLWSVTPAERDESGAQFVATISAPVLSGDVDAALQGRVASLVDGHVESQVGSTLALWRSIEGQGDRDLNGSTLNVEYEIAGFTENLISLRFFSDEQVAGSGGAKRQATTLMVDLTTGVAVGIDDVVVAGGVAQLLPLVQEGLLVDYFAGDQDAFSLWAGNLTGAELDSAALTPDGVEIWFDELEVGPPEIGTPVVLLSYDGLVSILDPAGMATEFTDA